MDAIRCKEWRIFPGLHLLDDKTGYLVFLFAHVPLFVFLIAGLYSDAADTYQWGLDIFFIIHLGLHIGYLFHPKNEFKDATSWILIAGAASCGAVELLIA